MSQNVRVERTLEFRHKGGGSPISIIDVDDSSNILYWRPETNDTGYIAIGDGTKDFDVWVTLGNATKYVLFDVGNDYLTLSNVNLRLPNILTSASPTAGIPYIVAATRYVALS